MVRILGLDYGQKRTGIAVTDPLQIIVNPLTTVETKELNEFLATYLKNEAVEKIVFGMPRHKDGNDTYLSEEIRVLGSKIKNSYPYLIVDYHDESFTSQTAKVFMIQSGMKKLKRQDKSELDKMSAVVILQEYLKHI
ncbi:MAG: Holliday junction resolvase RuvX [Saprospiraceae bacterium]|nr:Holliday junction resolvase RuvX [Saprospiraceae bacterium]MBK9994801.1 Holliday junction resolvase RuvX [Saprospiraceae bacterium]